METLPPVFLGVSLVIPFTAALALRRVLENRFVVSQPRIVQPRKQFFLDFALSLTASPQTGYYRRQRGCIP